VPEDTRPPKMLGCVWPQTATKRRRSAASTGRSAGCSYGNESEKLPRPIHRIFFLFVLAIMVRRPTRDFSIEPRRSCSSSSGCAEKGDKEPGRRLGATLEYRADEEIPGGCWDRVSSASTRGRGENLDQAQRCDEEEKASKSSRTRGFKAVPRLRRLCPRAASVRLYAPVERGISLRVSDT
jgi:hypothetical protein